MARSFSDITEHKGEIPVAAGHRHGLRNGPYDRLWLDRLPDNERTSQIPPYVIFFFP
jgi:hypothetical protein